MDAQGDEKIEMTERLYSILAKDASVRDILRDDLYFISDSVLGRFKMFQSFDYFTSFPGCRVEQAFLVWAQRLPNTRYVIASANGFALHAGNRLHHVRLGFGSGIVQREALGHAVDSTLRDRTTEMFLRKMSEFSGLPPELEDS